MAGKHLLFNMSIDTWKNNMVVSTISISNDTKRRKNQLIPWHWQGFALAQHLHWWYSPQNLKFYHVKVLIPKLPNCLHKQRIGLCRQAPVIRAPLDPSTLRTRNQRSGLDKFLPKKQNFQCKIREGPSHWIFQCTLLLLCTRSGAVATGNNKKKKYRKW